MEKRINALPDSQDRKHFHHVFARHYMAYGGDWQLLKSPYHGVVQLNYVSGKPQTALARAEAWLFCHNLPAYAFLRYALVRAVRLLIKER
jgi:hypothetical protein